MSGELQNLVMVYLVSQDKSKILMEFHKNPMDPSYNRYNGIDIYPKKEESLLECAQRAVKETGVQLKTLSYKGTVHWSKFDPKDAPLFGHFFTAIIDESSSIILETDDVRRKWIAVEDIINGEVPCWPGDSYIIPEIFSNKSGTFQGIMVYDKGLPSLWRFDRT